MLRFLSVAHLAIIDTLNVELAPGFNVVTGETGAGKSIVVGAIDLLLGGRASSDLVRTGAEQATVQAIIETTDNKELIIRREITASGRSRAYLDNALVTAGHLRAVTGPLIDLHGQHDHQQLLDGTEHLRLLDALARADDEVAAVEAAWATLVSARQAVDVLSMGQREREARLEMSRFQLAEIERVGAQPGEDEELQAERLRLTHADRLQRLVGGAYDDLYEADAAALTRLAQVWRRLDEAASLDPNLDAVEAHRQVQPVLDDLAISLRAYLGRLDSSPDRLQAVEDRLAAIERLKRRYGPTLDAAIDRARELKATIATLEAAADRGGELRARLASAEAGYRTAAQRLSEARSTTAQRLPALLERELAELAMERTRCAFPLESDLDAPERWTAAGVDRGELFISANTGETPRPLARIASGGELSRVMLALKTLASTDAAGKTLIFDEVDAGIGGRVADSVGRRLRELGTRFQVICITHLPQVAAHATAHYRVIKTVVAGRTLATMARLTEAEREEELARLLAGRAVTASTRATARDMLAAAAEAARPAIGHDRGESKDMAKGESESRRGTARGRRGA